MKFVVLFVAIATLITVHCKETLVERPNNDKEMSQMIRSVFCHGDKIDLNSIINNEDIMQRFSEKSIQEIQQLYCFVESTTPVTTNVTNTYVISDSSPSVILSDNATDNGQSDNNPVATKEAKTESNTGFSRPIVQPDNMVVSHITTDNTPLAVSEDPCQLLFIDPKNCDLACFKKRKLDVMKCVKNHIREYNRQYRQYLLRSLELDQTTYV